MVKHTAANTKKAHGLQTVKLLGKHEDLRKSNWLVWDTEYGQNLGLTLFQTTSGIVPGGLLAPSSIKVLSIL